MPGNENGPSRRNRKPIDADNPLAQGSRQLFRMTYWIALTCIVAVLILRLFEASRSGYDPLAFVQFVALTTLATCIVLLIGDLGKVATLPNVVRMGIMSSFVLSVLGTSAAFVGRTWMNNDDKLEVRTQLLDERLVTHLIPQDVFCASAHERRQTSDFPMPLDDEFGIFLGIVISNYRLDSEDRPDISGRISLITDLGLSVVKNLSEKPIRSVDDWKHNNINCPKKKDLDAIRSAVSLREGEILVLKFLPAILEPVRQRIAIEGNATLVVSVVDNERRMGSEAEDISLTFR